MGNLFEYNFDGARRPCFADQVSLEDFKADKGKDAEPQCKPADCPYTQCCDLAWRDPRLGTATAPKVGTMPR